MKTINLQSFNDGFPTLDLTLNKYVAPLHSDFGLFMLQFKKATGKEQEELFEEHYG